MHKGVWQCYNTYPTIPPRNCTARPTAVCQVHSMFCICRSVAEHNKYQRFGFVQEQLHRHPASVVAQVPKHASVCEPCTQPACWQYTW